MLHTQTHTQTQREREKRSRDKPTHLLCNCYRAFLVTAFMVTAPLDTASSVTASSFPWLPLNYDTLRRYRLFSSARTQPTYTNNE